MSHFDDNEDRIVYGWRTKRGQRQILDQLDRDAEAAGVRVAKCNRCGSEDVRWRQQGGKWVLFSSKPGVVHACDNSDDFAPIKD